MFLDIHSIRKFADSKKFISKDQVFPFIGSHYTWEGRGPERHLIFVLNVES